MRLPIVKNNNRYTNHVVTFGGLNLLQSFSAGEMTDCSGISHNSFPAITQRQKSQKVFSCISPSGASFAREECIAADDGLYYNRKKVMELEKGEKQLVFLGDRAIVFPDKVYYDTKSGEIGTLSGECVLKGVEVSFSENTLTVPLEHYEKVSLIQNSVFRTDANITVCEEVNVDGGKLIFSGYSLEKAENLEEGTIFCEKCEGNQYRVVISKQLSDDKKNYIVVNELVTLENTMKNVFSALRAGDVVEISGCTKVPGNNKSLKISSKGQNKLTFTNAAFYTATENSDIVIKRSIPDFTCVCNYQNRLWGCSGNTIYASALGDPFNFFLYENLSTDSYSVQSNSAGDFTACCVYGNYCLFFKENECFKLYGNKPSNFQLTESLAEGIKKTDSKSITNINGKIFYKGNGGIFVFLGGVSQCVSKKLGSISMENAIAGSDGKSFFITADTPEGREEYVYDIEKALWSKSGIKDTLGYSFYGGKMYRFKEDGVYMLTDSADTDAVWYVVLCPFNEKYYKTKNYSRLYITAQLFDDSYLNVEVSCDDSVWRKVATVYGNQKKYVNIPCVLKSCHEVRIRISGKGKSIIESVTREFSVN